ncbi:MAG: hypothetical protein AAF439_08030 [Pseudomonadota bacterium]
MKKVCLIILVALTACDEEDPTIAAMDAANGMVAARDYNEALAAYDAILAEQPELLTAHYNRGTLQLLRFEKNAALPDLEIARESDDPALAARVEFNLGVLKYVQAREALQTFQDALSLTNAAIGHWRTSLQHDPDQPDARYNLEIAYRLVDDINAQNVQGQRNAETRDQKTSDNRGQAFENEPETSDSELSNEQAPMSRPDGMEAGQGQVGNQKAAPLEQISEMQEAGRQQNLSPAEAEEMLQLMRQKAAQSQNVHQSEQQVRIISGAPVRYW